HGLLVFSFIIERLVKNTFYTVLVSPIQWATTNKVDEIRLNKGILILSDYSWQLLAN
ncbi:MAG: hypothetical protein JWP57_3114, partial [Spirosoma sp.]|nr:hypothetical protein [Spirosoma sp.]